MKKRLMILAIVVALVIGLMPVTAFATGESLEHSGTSSTGYYTSDYVEQKNDNNMYCTYAYASNSGMEVYPVMRDDNDNWVRLTDNRSFSTGHKFVFQDWDYVRRIHLRIANMGTPSTYTHGIWSLEP